jgi:hypothetical protein
MDAIFLTVCTNPFIHCILSFQKFSRENDFLSDVIAEFVSTGCKAKLIMLGKE